MDKLENETFSNCIHIKAGVVSIIPVLLIRHKVYCFLSKKVLDQSFKFIVIISLNDTI